MKKLVLGFVIAVLVFAGTSVQPALAVANEAFKQSNNVEFSSSDASKGGRGDFVYYSQKDPKWKLYGPNNEGITIYEAGCGPTSLAMIIATFNNSSVTPQMMADAGYENGSLLSGVGTVHAPLLEAAKKKGWINDPIDFGSQSIEELMSFVKSGGLIYMSGHGSAPFTSSGHLVVMRDADILAGTITIADPWRGEADVYPKEVVDTYRSDVNWGFTKQ